MRPLLATLIVIVLAAAGCGRTRAPRDQTLRFEEIADTTGLARGAPLVTEFAPVRIGSGLMMVRGRAELPDSTRLQVSVLAMPGEHVVARLQVLMDHGRFTTTPFLGGRRPLPVGDYRFEVLAHFNPAWQTGSVLRLTADGRALRGPGVTRGLHGEAIFRLVEEQHL